MAYPSGVNTGLSSAARAAATSVVFPIQAERGLAILVDVTARANATTVTPSLALLASRAASETYMTIWSATAAIDTADGSATYMLYTGGAQGGSMLWTEFINGPLPVGEYKLTMTPSDGSSLTYSVDVRGVM